MNLFGKELRLTKMYVNKDRGCLFLINWIVMNGTFDDTKLLHKVLNAGQYK